MPCLTFIPPALSPAEQLALDEAMLDQAEMDGTEWLWFWESPVPWVVVGLGQSVTREVDEAACRQRGVPILRRCSGGGAVVQGPGCLNYALVLQLDRHPELAAVTTTNRWIMERLRAALSPLDSRPLAVRGHTDLVLVEGAEERKFSGNAQRRRRRALLFHGTMLLHFELQLASALLRHPSAEPEYRAGRPHADFVANTGWAAPQVQAAITAAWDGTRFVGELPWGRVQELVAVRYGLEAWNFRR